MLATELKLTAGAYAFFEVSSVTLILCFEIYLPILSPFLFFDLPILCCLVPAY